ncbi:hypothetical protein MMC34_002448 [Xylographa carneopallida]|nr:hypothetical protein [Xylographa carneopallida]
MASTTLTDLPTELLEFILRCFLVTRDPPDIRNYFVYYREPGWNIRLKLEIPLKLQPSLLRICKATHNVGVRILYKENRFHFRGPHGLFAFAKLIGSKAALISHISFYDLNAKFANRELGYFLAGLTKRKAHRQIAEFKQRARDGIVRQCFPNLDRLTLDKRDGGKGSARDIAPKLRSIPRQVKLEEAMREQLGPNCQIDHFPP